MRILIVDDYDLLCDFLVVFMQVEGNIDMDIVVNFDEVCVLIDGYYIYDLVLFDYNMLGMNGFEGLKIVVDCNGVYCVVLMLGEVSCEIVEQVFEMGVIGFIFKMLLVKFLVNVIKFMVMGEKYVFLDFMIVELELNNYLFFKLLMD